MAEGQGCTVPGEHCLRTTSDVTIGFRNFGDAIILVTLSYNKGNSNVTIKDVWTSCLSQNRPPPIAGSLKKFPKERDFFF